MWHIQGVLVQPLCHQRIHLLSSSQGDHQISIQIEDFTDLTAVVLLGVLRDRKTALLPRKKEIKTKSFGVCVVSMKLGKLSWQMIKTQIAKATNSFD